ncbi:ABC transporter permease [Paracidovorax konjaci]|uniref:Peptide/nickel transport system permease protein n=1 Tax=Paracidovorax konjaci TaxID=32040 RepID=A0A1I1SDM9_9BURK|nr:ABC transporter permease [Paracidovorax konjaci]SFD44432.1 peptide/nickel transport system permease protein [Paracidovorax konjaci]
MTASSRTRRRAGLAILGLLAVFAALGPALVGTDPAQQALDRSLLPPGSTHWLGTDLFGRSTLARLAHAAQLSLGLALVASFSAAVPGVLLGVAASWRGGTAERCLVLLADAVLAVPGLLLVLLFAALAPGRHWALYVGLSLSLWVEYFRVGRAASRPVLAGDAVQASRLLGFGPVYVLRRHVLPALSPVLSTLLPFSAAQAVLALAALGFIGVGIQPPTAELGLMMTEALPHYEEAPWLMAAPVGLLMLLVLGMALVAGTGERA